MTKSIIKMTVDQHLETQQRLLALETLCMDIIQSEVHSAANYKHWVKRLNEIA